MTNDAAETLKEVRKNADRLTVYLPKRVQATAFTGKSKLPFKAAAIRELLLHRTATLASAAVDLYEGNRVIPAVILTRSIVETLALLFNFHERLEHFLKGEVKDSDALDDSFMCCLVGSRNNPEGPKAVNVLTLIDRVEKTVPDFRFVYDALSECAHPNWAGTFGAFGHGHDGNHSETTELELGPREQMEAYSPGLSALSSSLMSFEHYYNDSGKLVRQLNEYFDRDAAH
jgi:hypothetical protein